MNIAILDMDNLKNDHWGAGQARATREIAKRLVSIGHRATVFSSKYPGFTDYTEEGVEYRHIGIGSNSPRLNNIAYIFSLFFITRRITADIIVESFTPPISTCFVPLFTTIPVVGYATFFAASDMARKYKLPFEVIEKFGLKFYKYFVALNPSDEARAKAINPALMSTVISEGVDEMFFRINRAKAEHILFLGRWDTHQKGIDLLFETYVKIATRCGYPLLIAGHGPGESFLRSSIAKLRLEKFVKIVGSAYGDKKTEILSKSICAVLPSRYETFSLFALEALASGLPIVTFDIPGLSWSSAEVALKAPPFNVDAYAKCILRAVEPEVNAQMSQAARSFARRYTWNAAAKEFEIFF